MKRIILRSTQGTIIECMPGPVLPVEIITESPVVEEGEERVVRSVAYRPETDEEHTARVVARTLEAAPPGSPLHNAEVLQVCDHTDLPDRFFFNAFDHDGQKVVIDMPKARNLIREKLRVKRKPLLAALDVDYQRADEAGDTTKKLQIASEKNRLRNLPAMPEIDAATTPEALKALLDL